MSIISHSKQREVNTLLEHKIPVLLEGPSGSGKTTILMNAAKKAGVPYSFISGTRQTTVSHIIGFMNVNGVYSPSPFRKAYEEGHYFNIDEMDAMDSNVLLIFNSLENDIMYFPDGYTEPPHENFRLMATANPQDEHDRYVGRSKIDAATLDRYDRIRVDRDNNLEKSLISEDTAADMAMLRESLIDVNSSIELSMRDSIRYEKRKNLNLHEGLVEKMLGNNALALEKYLWREGARIREEELLDVSKCTTADKLWEAMNAVEDKRIKEEENSPWD